jgi:hypothetical protein
MSGEVEFGKCEICNENKPLERTYYHYDIKCECHSPRHFEFVRHCKDCVPKEPIETKIIMKTSDLRSEVFKREAIEHLQSNIHKITGDGEIMMLFNKLLGVNSK